MSRGPIIHRLLGVALREYLNDASACAGLAPEYVEFRDGQGMVTLEKGRHNLLRPEAMEAMFVLWRTTGNPVYKDWAWQMFQAFQTHCRVSSLSYSRTHLDWHLIKGQIVRVHRNNADRAALHARMPACQPARVAGSFMRWA